MSFSTVPAPEPMASEIYDAVKTHYMEAVYLSSVGIKLRAQRDELLKTIEGKIDRHTVTRVSDLCMAFACEYGDEMFKLGIAFGRDPGLIFALPEVDGGKLVGNE